MTETDRPPGSKLERAPPVRPPKTRWNQHSKRLLKLAMVQEDVSYKRLAQLLREDDPESDDTAESLTTRINRGTFTFAFGLRVLRVLGTTNLDISRVQLDAERRKATKK